MTHFAFPYTYGFATRAKTALDKLSFFAVFVFPLLVVSFIGSNDYLKTAVRFAIGFTVLYVVYEIGYLQNDVYTTKREAHPVIRLSPEDHALVSKHAALLIAIRILYAVLGLLLLVYLEQSNVLAFAGVLIMLFCVFDMHNTVRSKANALTYLILCSLKYFALPFLLLPQERLGLALIAVFVSFSLPRSIEHASKPKYSLPLFSSIGNHDKFRVIYYAVLSVLSFVGWYFSPSFSVIALLSLWFLGYRSLVLVALMRNERLRVKYR